MVNTVLECPESAPGCHQARHVDTDSGNPTQSLNLQLYHNAPIIVMPLLPLSGIDRG